MNLDRGISISAMVAVLTLFGWGFVHESAQDIKIAVLETDLKHQDSTIVEVKEDITEIKADVKTLLLRGVPTLGEA